MFKFLIGPLVGYQLRLSIWESFSMTLVGMMMGVIVFVYLGQQLKKHVIKRFFQKKLFSPRNRRVVRVWRRYGLFGIAFLTPILLSPPGGTLIAASFGEKKMKIIYYMFLSGLFWSAATVALVYLFGNIAKV
ncbi:MAG: hypothetical protein AAFU64_00485 [Bacteroidota bacterium]